MYHDVLFVLNFNKSIFKNLVLIFFKCEYIASYESLFGLNFKIKFKKLIF